MENRKSQIESDSRVHKALNSDDAVFADVTIEELAGHLLKNTKETDDYIDAKNKFIKIKKNPVLKNKEIKEFEDLCIEAIRDIRALLANINSNTVFISEMNSKADN